MFSNKLMIIGLVIATTFATTACSTISKNVNSSAVANNKQSETQDTDEELVLTIETVDISDIENGKIYQDVKYPVVEYKNNATMQKSMDELNKNTKELAEKFKSDNKTYVRDYIKEYKNNDAMYTYDSSMTCSFHNDKYLSLLNTIYIYTMGAHGLALDNGYTYDIETGKLLTLKDFIKDEEELKAYLKDWARKQEEGMLFPEAEESIDNYFKDEYELQFKLVDNELIVIFQQYDIAPYAAGIIEVPIDKSLLKVELV